MTKVVFTEKEGVKSGAIIDTGAGATPQVLLSIILTKKPIRTETKKIETLMSINTRKIKIYSVKIQDINCEFGFETKLNHLEKDVLLELPNPKYWELQNT